MSTYSFECALVRAERHEEVCFPRGHITIGIAGAYEKKAKCIFFPLFAVVRASHDSGNVFVLAQNITPHLHNVSFACARLCIFALATKKKGMRALQRTTSEKNIC